MRHDVQSAVMIVIASAVCFFVGYQFGRRNGQRGADRWYRVEEGACAKRPPDAFDVPGETIESSWVQKVGDKIYFRLPPCPPEPKR